MGRQAAEKEDTLWLNSLQKAAKREGVSEEQFTLSRLRSLMRHI